MQTYRHSSSGQHRSPPFVLSISADFPNLGPSSPDTLNHCQRHTELDRDLGGRVAKNFCLIDDTPFQIACVVLPKRFGSRFMGHWIGVDIG